MSTRQRYTPVPSSSTLAGLRRDLRFRPVMRRPRLILGPGGIEAFNRDGFLLGLPALGPGELVGWRRYFDVLLRQALAAGAGRCSLRDLHLRYAGAGELMRHPRILGCVRDLLGSDVIGWECQYFSKPPRDPRTIPWHRDAPYWPLTPSKTVNVWLALDDTHPENGCLQYLPGSHLDDLPARRGERPGPVRARLAAGQMAIHSDLVLHGSGPNRSDGPRRVVTLRYCTPTVSAELGWSARGIVVSGTDPTGAWCGRGVSESRPATARARRYSSPSPTISRSV